MNFFESCFQSPLGSMQGKNYSEDEVLKLRRRAWREFGILIVPPSVSGISRVERQVLFQVAERLYGKVGEL